MKRDLPAPFEPLAQNLFHRTRLAGEFRKAQQVRFVDASRAHREYGHRIFFRRALQDDGIEVFEATREVRQSAQRFRGFFDAAMDRRGALEIERFAGRFALALKLRSEGGAACREKCDDAAHFRVVVFLEQPAKHGARHIFISE